MPEQRPAADLILVVHPDGQGRVSAQPSEVRSASALQPSATPSTDADLLVIYPVYVSYFHHGKPAEPGRQVVAVRHRPDRPLGEDRPARPLGASATPDESGAEAEATELEQAWSAQCQVYDAILEGALPPGCAPPPVERMQTALPGQPLEVLSREARQERLGQAARVLIDLSGETLATGPEAGQKYQRTDTVAVIQVGTDTRVALVRPDRPGKPGQARTQDALRQYLATVRSTVERADQSLYEDGEWVAYRVLEVCPPAAAPGRNRGHEPGM